MGLVEVEDKEVCEWRSNGVVGAVTEDRGERGVPIRDDGAVEAEFPPRKMFTLNPGTAIIINHVRSSY